MKFKSGTGGLKQGLQKAGQVLIMAAAAVFINACAANHVYKAPITADIYERAPKSMKVEVTDFNWTYLESGLLEVTGQVKNNTGQAQPQVTLFAILFDEEGSPVALGESFVSPAHLSAGAHGTFRIVARASRPAGIKHLRLLTKAVHEYDD